MSRTRAVLFDAVGTLFHWRGTIGEVYAGVAARHGVRVSHVDLQSRFAALAGAEGLPHDRAGWRQRVEAVFRGLGAFDDFDAFFQELFSSFQTGHGWELFAETRPVLTALSQNGLKLGVVTNFDDRVHQVLRDLDVDQCFGTVQTPESSGFRKPESGIFRAAARELKCPEAEALFIGDDPVLDLAGALGAGMRALLVDRRQNAAESPLIIPDLGGVLRFLESSGRQISS